MTDDGNFAAPGISYFTPKQSPPASTAVTPQKSGKLIPKLFQPLRIRGVEFQNRIFLSPMSQYSAKDGIVTPWHMAHIGGIVSRGPGLTMIEATSVLPEGRLSPQDVGLWSDEQIKPLAQLVEFAHSQSQKIAIQLAHAGRKASSAPPWLSAGPVASKETGGWPDEVVGPSPVPFHEAYPIPKELTKEGIGRVVKAFAEAAKRAVQAGFDVIEVHAAHGYLLSTFLSPTSNRRTDEYGGSFENRIRLTLEVVDAIRAVIPDTMPLFLRISGTEWLEEIAPNEPSWCVEDTTHLAPILAEHGVDLLDVSAGGIDWRQKIRPGLKYQVPFAAAAKRAVGSRMLVSAIGGLANGVVAEEVLQAGDADAVFIGRAFQKNPGVVWKMADDLGVEIHVANQIKLGFTGRSIQLMGESDASKEEGKL
ncbi:unnamed protein product [Cyclocybe aegerita]|uniref:NADH:flavin oxidoreductase/NADH oxidase N-terminal domain-containing protein n=1 Tax=Cyclocybe aegerita TaxID=1973307 RepID=A0A8S0VV00_CYCAE|nr:unnamed protein product [Cyclocybe aegerita]